MKERFTTEQCLEKLRQIEDLTKELKDNHPFVWESMGRALLESLYQNAAHVRIELEVQQEFSNGK